MSCIAPRGVVRVSGGVGLRPPPPGPIQPSGGIPLAGLPRVALDECVAAALRGGPAVQAAQWALETASANLTQVRAKQGLIAGESVGYTPCGHQPVVGGSVSGGGGGLGGRGFRRRRKCQGRGFPERTGLELGRLGCPRFSSQRLRPSFLLWAFRQSGPVGWDSRRRPWRHGQSGPKHLRGGQTDRGNRYQNGHISDPTAYYTLLGDQKTLAVRQATLQTAPIQPAARTDHASGAAGHPPRRAPSQSRVSAGPVETGIRP